MVAAPAWGEEVLGSGAWWPRRGRRAEGGVRASSARPEHRGPEGLHGSAWQPLTGRFGGASPRARLFSGRFLQPCQGGPCDFFGGKRRKKEIGPVGLVVSQLTQHLEEWKTMQTQTKREVGGVTV